MPLGAIFRSFTSFYVTVILTSISPMVRRQPQAFYRQNPASKWMVSSALICRSSKKSSVQPDRCPSRHTTRQLQKRISSCLQKNMRKRIFSPVLRRRKIFSGVCSPHCKPNLPQEKESRIFHYWIIRPKQFRKNISFSHLQTPVFKISLLSTDYPHL